MTPNSVRRASGPFGDGMRNSPEIGAIGAFDGKRLCAYMITCREDGWLNILHQMSSHDDLKSFPNHALTFSVTRAAAEDPLWKGFVTVSCP